VAITTVNNVGLKLVTYMLGKQSMLWKPSDVILAAGRGSKFDFVNNLEWLKKVPWVSTLCFYMHKARVAIIEYVSAHLWVIKTTGVFYLYIYSKMGLSALGKNISSVTIK